MTRTRRPTVEPVSMMAVVSGSVRVRGAGPRSEEALDERHHVLAAEVATDHERRPARVERPAVDASELGAAESLDRLARPAGRAVIGRLRRVDRAHERLVGTSSRVGPDLEEVVQALVAQPLDLGFGERRAEEDLGDELEGRCQPGGRHVDADRDRVPAGVGVERGAQPFRGLDQGDRVVALGPLGQRAGGQDGRTGHVRRLLDRPAGDDHRGRHERATRQVRDHDGEAVRQAAAGDGRELVGARRAGRGSLGDDRTVPRRIGGRAHAATSASVAASPASASSGESATSSSVVPSGR